MEPYAVLAKNTLFNYDLVSLDFAYAYRHTRAGSVSGMHAIECMMDELAYELKWTR